MSSLGLRIWDPMWSGKSHLPCLNGWDCTDWLQVTGVLGLGTPCEPALNLQHGFEIVFLSLFMNLILFDFYKPCKVFKKHTCKVMMGLALCCIYYHIFERKQIHKWSWWSKYEVYICIQGHPWCVIALISQEIKVFNRIEKCAWRIGWFSI